MPRPDGTFVVEATPGDYRVNLAPFLTGAPTSPRFSVSIPKGFENAYVKSIRLGEIDVLNEGLHLDGPVTSALTIVLGMNPGSVGGTVVADSQSPAAGATVALLPDIRGRFDLVRTVTTDPSGRFVVNHVVPGEYKVFAWTEISAGDWQDPDVIRAHEARGTALHVGDGAAENIRVTVITP
jgi:hypothetical protein